MVLITPRLVRALEPDEVPPLPTLPRRFLPGATVRMADQAAKSEPKVGAGAGRCVRRSNEGPRRASPVRRTEASSAMSRRQQSSRRARVPSLFRLALLAFVLMAFNVFVMDYGVMWMARGQAQNAADAGALAGAIARGYDDFDVSAASGVGRWPQCGAGRSANLSGSSRDTTGGFRLPTWHNRTLHVRSTSFATANSAARALPTCSDPILGVSIRACAPRQPGLRERQCHSLPPSVGVCR